MPTIPIVGQQSATAALMDEFLELVYGDEELLRDEFDAIVAQEWSDRIPPVSPRATRRFDDPLSGSHPGSGRSKPTVDRSPVRAVRKRNRQRSPPW